MTTARDGDGRGEAWKTLHWLWALELWKEAGRRALVRVRVRAPVSFWVRAPVRFWPASSFPRWPESADRWC